MQQVGRRRFLCCLGGAGAVASLAPALWPHMAEAGFDAEGTSIERPGETVVRCGPALGTTVTIRVRHTDRGRGERAITAAFRELDRIEDLMSIYRPNSQLSRLNRDELLTQPHPYLVEVLEYAAQLSERTSGAFDVTVQPLWELYSAARQRGEVPSSTDVRQAVARVNWRAIEVGNERIRYRRPGTQVTLNGIGQGFAADRVRAVLRDHGVASALIDTGELSALGEKTNADPWQVGVQHPREEAAFLALVALRDRCLATSGDYATTFTADRSHHHLLDPRTGRSPSELASVTVAASTAVEADALSTATFVLGVERGAALIAETPGADALLVSKSGRRFTTKGFPAA